MSHQPYSYNRRYTTRYTFVSKGRKGAIVKIAQFTPTSVTNVLNLSFGDLRSDGTIDDAANTNNNDIVKVMVTIVDIINDFTTENPSVKIVFIGNTKVRTSLYNRILKMYYTIFSKTYIITALIKDGSSFIEVPFETETNNKYLAFFVKRK